MAKLIVLASFFASGAYAKRAAYTNVELEIEAVADGPGFVPGGLQRAWQSAIAPGASMAPQLNLHGGQGSLRPNRSPVVAMQDGGEYLPDIPEDWRNQSVPSDGCDGEECELPELDSVIVNGVDVSGSSLRSTELVNTRGERVSVSSLIGDEGKAVVVFLRHLG